MEATTLVDLVARDINDGLPLPNAWESTVLARRDLCRHNAQIAVSRLHGEIQRKVIGTADAEAFRRGVLGLFDGSVALGPHMPPPAIPYIQTPRYFLRAVLLLSALCGLGGFFLGFIGCIIVW